MADGVREGRLLPPEDIVGEDMIIGKGLAQEVLAHVVGVHFELRADGHDVLDEIQIAEGDSGLEGVHRDAAVGAQHVVHIQLVDALLRLLLEGFGRGREVGIFIAEQLVGNFAGHEHAHVGLLVDGLAAQVHAHARADGGDVIGAEQRDDLFEGIEHLPARHGDLGVVRADEIGSLLRVFEVDGVKIHADGKRPDLFSENLGRDGTHKAGIQAAGEQEAERRVGVKPLFHARDKLFADGLRDGVEIVVRILCDRRQVRVADEFAVLVIMARREGEDVGAEADEVFRLTGEDDRAVFEIPVEQRADADGVARGDEGIGRRVIDDHGELRVELGKHIRAIFLPQGQDDLAVGIGLELIALRLEHGLDRAEAVQLAVAHGHVAAEVERLHAFRMQPHDGEPVETEQAAAGRLHPRVVRAAGLCLLKIRLDLFLLEPGGRKTDNCAHKKHLRIICAALPEINSRTNCCRSAVPPNLLSETVSFPEL